MAASFLHGVEVIKVRQGRFAIRVVKTAIIGLVGTAPVHLVEAADKTVNQLVMSTNETDDAKYFGAEATGYTIPTALKQIREQQEPGAGVVVYAINTFNPATHKAAVAAEAKTFANNKLTLTSVPLAGSVVVKSSDDATTYAETTHYTVDYKTGVVTRVEAGTIPNNATVNVAYDKADPSLVLAADVIGATSGSGVRTGMQLFKESRTKFGASPKILIAPGFGTQATVEAALAVITTAVGGNYIVDAPVGTSVADAIQGRGAAGTINFGGASPRKICAYPHLKRLSGATGAVELVPFSSALAGVMAVVDMLKGYWHSPSNTAIKGIVGLERNLTADFADATCEVNLLNEVGIVTVANFNGDYLVWGNRNASFPSTTLLESFIPMQRLADVVDESILLAMLPNADKPLNRALIDDTVETVNGFMRTQVGRGALIDGKCWFDEAANNVETLTMGQAVYAYDFCGYTPNERQTFKSSSNPDYLAQLLGG
jgi:phage tail sheath protein FI